MRRTVWIVIALFIAGLLIGCQATAKPDRQELTALLAGEWLDPLTGWTYTFAADGHYAGQAPPLADGINILEGDYVLDDDGFIELSLARQVPRKPFVYYEQHSVWQIAELDKERLVLILGRKRLSLARQQAP